MCIVYLQLELEAWRSGCGKQQSDERRDSENPHTAKEKLQRKTETQNSLKTGAIPLHIYLCSSLCSLYFYVLSFLFIALEADWKPFYSHMALERLKYSIVWAQHPF